MSLTLSQDKETREEEARPPSGTLLGRAVRRILGARRPMNITYRLRPHRRLGGQEMARRVFFGNRLPVERMSEQGLEVLQTNHARRNIHKWSIKTPEEFCVVHRPAGRVYSAFRVTFRVLARNLR